MIELSKKMILPIKWGVALAVLCASIVAAQPVWAASTAPKLPVVATFSILGDVAGQVGGDTVKVTTLVGPDSDAHTFVPSPQDNISLTKAQLIFEIGLAFETWLDKLYEVSESPAARVVVSQGLTLLSAGPEDGHDVDPHIWQNVQNVIHITQRAGARGLCRAILLDIILIHDYHYCGAESIMATHNSRYGIITRGVRSG